MISIPLKIIIQKDDLFASVLKNLMDTLVTIMRSWSHSVSFINDIEIIRPGYVIQFVLGRTEEISPLEKRNCQLHVYVSLCDVKWKDLKRFQNDSNEKV